jgi:PAS domain S-box-containing protein
MPLGRFNTRLLRAPRPADYLIAFCLAAIAVLIQLRLEVNAPTGALFVTLFPATVLAGVFCGTAPAAVASLLGAAAVATLSFGRTALIAPPFNHAQTEILLFLPACVTVLWATHALRRAAADATRAERRLAEMFRQFPGVAAILQAPDGRVLLRSARSNAVLGHEQRALATDGLFSYGGLHPDGRPYAPADYPIVRALKTGEIVHGERLRYRRDDGSIVHLELHAAPIRDPNGHISGSVGMAFDISDRVDAECRLIESEALHRAAAERLRAAIDAGALGLWELDIAAQHVRLDAAAAAMVGLPAEPIELARDRFSQLIDPADRERALAALERTMNGGPYADEYCVRTPQGETRWIISRGTILPDLKIAVGVVGDVTERRQRENALRDALHARDVLMYEADHRIKNSLQLVVSLLRLQLNRVPHPDARDALSQAISRVDAVANAHLSLQSSPDLRSIDADTMLAELCARVGTLNPSLTLSCDTAIHHMLDTEIAIPLGLLASELLTNALRHAYPAGARGVVILAAHTDAGSLTMTVADRGRGLAAAGRPALGTTVITMLARQIGATVNRESAPGDGTIVTVRLPLPLSSGALAAAEAGKV